jgi:putative NADH-flavin reductase
MKITVFGASGAIGRLVVQKLLSDGHEVVAYVRRAEAFPGPVAGLSVVVGSLADEPLVRRAVTGSGAVISALGPSLGRPADPQATPVADGHRVILSAMRESGVRRLVTLATPAVKVEREPRVLATTLPPALARRFLPWAYRDIVAAGQVVSTSCLDWTVVRIINPNLKHRGRSYSTWLGEGRVRFGVSRQNAAACLVDSATKGLFVGKMPIVFDARENP